MNKVTYIPYLNSPMEISETGAPDPIYGFILGWVVQYINDSWSDEGKPSAQLWPAIATNIPSKIAAHSICI